MKLPVGPRWPSINRVVVQQPMTNKLDSHFAQDGDYLAMLNEMQQGQWGRAVPLLQALQARYPIVSIVDELLHEATLRDKWDKHLSFYPMDNSLPSTPTTPAHARFGSRDISDWVGERSTQNIDILLH